MDQSASPEDTFSRAGGKRETHPVTRAKPNGASHPESQDGETRRESREEPTEEWNFVCPTTLLHLPVPPRRFIVDEWLPAGTVTINYGDGGVGKTLLAQQLMTSCATGLAWCGLAVERCVAVGLFCEDDENELHRRQDAINRAYGIDFNRLEYMTWASGVGLDNTLVSFDIDGKRHLTKKFEALTKRSEGAGLVVVDTAADTFGGNENVRREVRQFVGAALGKLAKDTGAAVLLNAHPSRAGLSQTGDLDGGSTAWSNTARSRWSLSRSKAEGDEQADTNERLLTRRKANYASIGDTIKLRWQNGVLVPISAPIGLSAMAQEADAEAVFLRLLERFTCNGVRLSQSKHGTNWAPKEFAKAPDRCGLNAKEFDAAMNRLLAASKIEVRDFGRAARPLPGLAIVAPCEVKQ
jgi:RecA-family ATPase